MSTSRTPVLLIIRDGWGSNSHPEQVLTKAVAQELASRGITVNAIAPGFMTSAMTDALNDQQRESILSRIPLGAMGTGEDIGAAVVYLASREAGYVTGQTLHVNGGMAMP